MALALALALPNWALLSGCGQKGKLYLAPASAAAKVSGGLAGTPLDAAADAAAAAPAPASAPRP